MGNPFCHVELHTQDPESAKKFYLDLFDWKLEDHQVGEETYTMIEVGEGTGGGLMQHPMPGAPSYWLAYILVDDVAASTEKAKGLGATVVQERMEVPGYGWLSVIADPAGATIGLWEAAEQ